MLVEQSSGGLQIPIPNRRIRAKTNLCIQARLQYGAWRRIRIDDVSTFSGTLKMEPFHWCE